MSLKIKQLRKQKRITQEEISRVVGISKRAFISYENGEIDVPVSKLQKIASALGVTIYDLLNEDHNIVSEPMAKYGIQHSVLVPIVSKYNHTDFQKNHNEIEYVDRLNKMHWVNDYGVAVDKLMTFEMKGDKMDDNTPNSFLDGDLLLGIEIEQSIWQNLHLGKWSYIVVHETKGVEVCRINDVKNELLKCHNLNPFYSDFDLELDKTIKVYRIAEMKREPRF